MRERDRQRRVRRAERVIADGRARIRAIEAMIEATRADIDGDADDGPPPSLPERIRRLMSDGARRSTAETADALGVATPSVGDAMKRIARSGWLTRLSPGVYIHVARVPRPRGDVGGSGRGDGGPQG